MSAKITVLCSARTYQLKRNLAARKVARGGFRWRDRFTIEEIPSETMPKPAPFAFVGMPGWGCVWVPRMSAFYLVMQAKH